MSNWLLNDYSFLEELIFIFWNGQYFKNSYELVGCELEKRSPKMALEGQSTF